MKNDKPTGSIMARQKSAGAPDRSGDATATANRNHSAVGTNGLSSASTGNLAGGGQRSKTAGAAVTRAGSAKYYDIASTILGKTGDVETVFFNAAKNGNVAKLEQILSQRDHANLDIDCRDKRTGNTALMWAAKRGHSKVVELLLNHGADPTLCNYEAQSAIELGFSPVKTLLLDWVEAEQEVTSRLLLQAAWQGNLAMVSKILASGGSKLINVQNADGLTPLMLVTRDIQLFERLAAQLNRHYSPVEVAEELIKAGANIHVTDNDGRSSLHYASQSKAGMADRLVNTLVGGGLDPELRDKRLFTPIHLASQLGNTQNVVALIDGGSEVNVRGFGGITPLHMTAYNDHQKTAMTLLNHGADVCIVDERGLTAVDLAKTRRMKVMLKEAWMDATTHKGDNQPDTDINSNDTKKQASVGDGSGTENEAKKKKSAPVKKRPEVIFDNLKSANNFPNGVTAANKNKGLSNVEKCKQRERKILEDVEALKAAHPVLQRETTRMLGTTRTKILPQIGRSSSPDRSQGSLVAPEETDRVPALGRGGGGGEESRWSLEETRLQLLSRGRSISDIKLGIGRQSRLSTVPHTDADLLILEDLKSSISAPSPAFNRRGFHHLRTGSDGATANMADIAASCEQFLPNTRGKRGTKPFQSHSNGGSHPSSPAFITQQSFSFSSGGGGGGKEHEISPRQEDRFIQACNSPMDLLRCRSLLKEDFVLEESRPKEATSSGSDPTSSTSSLSSSPRDSSSIPPYSSPSKTLKHDPSLTTLVEHTAGSHRHEKRNNRVSDILILNDEKLPALQYEFNSKPLIRNPQSRRRRNSDNSASSELSSSSEFNNKMNFSPRFQKDRGLTRSSSQRNTPSSDNNMSSLSPRLLSTIRKSQSIESLSPKRSPSPDNRQQSHSTSTHSSAMKTKDSNSGASETPNLTERKLSLPETAASSKDRSIPEQHLSGKRETGSKAIPTLEKKSPPVKQPIAPFSGKAKVVSSKGLDSWDSLNQGSSENVTDNHIQRESTDSNCLFTPVKSADGPKKSFSNQNISEDSKRNAQVAKSCSDKVKVVPDQETRPHTSGQQVSSSSVRIDSKDITGKPKQSVSFKDQNPATKSISDASVRKSTTSSTKTPLRKSVSNPPQGVGGKLAAKLLAVGSPSVSPSATITTSTSKSIQEKSSGGSPAPVNMFVVSEDSVRMGSASKERMKERERLASAKRLKNETVQESDSKQKEENSEPVAAKDKPISKVVAKIEKSLKKNDAQIALQRKSLNSMPKEDPSNKTSNTSKSVSIPKTSTEPSGSTKVLNHSNNYKNPNVPSAESNAKTNTTSAKKDGKSIASTVTSSSVKAAASSSASLSSTSTASITTKTDNNSKTPTFSPKQKQTISSSGSISTKQSPSTARKPEIPQEDPKQAKAIDPTVILTPRSTEPLVKIKLKSNSDVLLNDSSSPLTTRKSNSAITCTPLIVNPYEEFTSQNIQSSHTLQQTTKDAVVKLKKTPKTISSSTKSSKKTSTSSTKRPQSGSSKQGVVKKKGVKSKDTQKEGRPKSSKKSSKKKELQEHVDSNLDFDVESENPDKAIISGIGWRFSTSCNDMSNVHPAKDIPLVESGDHILYNEITKDESDEFHLTREFEQMLNNVVELEGDVRGKGQTDMKYQPSEIDKQSLEVFKERITLNSPRFLEMKRRQESQLNIELPVLTDDGFPPMNLDVMQQSSSMMKNNEKKNFYDFEDSQQQQDYEDSSSPSHAENNEAIQREIFLNKLTPIPEASYVSKTISAISKFDKSIKDDRLSELLEETPREGVTTGRNDASHITKQNIKDSSVVSNPKNDSFSYQYTYTSSGKTIKKSQSFKEKGSEKPPVKERKFSETKQPSETKLNQGDDCIEDAIEEILSSTISSTTSTLKGYDFKSNNMSASNTLTEQDRNVLRKLTSGAKDSPFHARSQDATRRSANASPLPPSPEDITQELQNLEKKLTNNSAKSASAGNSAKNTPMVKSASISSSASPVISSGKPPLSNRASLNSMNTPRSNSNVTIKRSTSMRDTRSKGQSGQSIDIKNLNISEEESKQLARVMNSLRHMELHAGSQNSNNFSHREHGFGGSAKVTKTTNKGDTTPVGHKNKEGISLPASASMMVRPSSTGAAAAAKYRGRFHELKEYGASGGGGGGSGAAAGGGGGSSAKKMPSSNNLVVSQDVRSSSVNSGYKQASRDQQHSMVLDDKLMESLTGDLDHAKDAEEIQNLYIRLTERRDSLCGSEISLDSCKSVDDTIQWKKGNILGKGAFGTVWCGLTSEGELIAVKQIELTTMNQAKAHHEYEKIQEEVELLKTLDHINIVGYLGTSLEDNIVSIFMQFIPGGSLASILARFGALEESVFRRYTKQILEGVEYLHDNDVIHRDLKGANVMLMPTGVIKLIDFGCAKRMCINLNLSHTEILKSMKGTPFWMAPEVVNETGHGKKSDIWSIGCTVFEMATRKPPWADMNQMAAIFAIGRGDKPVPRLSDKFSQDAIDFVSACMTRDQVQRPGAKDLLNHVFIARKNTRKASKAKEENISNC